MGGSQSPDDVNSQSGMSLKRRRITRACDRCHRSGVKCSTSSDPSTCGPCAAFGSDCTYNRPIKRRGPVPRGNPSTESAAARGLSTSLSSASADPWVYEPPASAEVINTLVETYHRVVYPILPYFHWPTFAADVHARRYTTDRAFFCAVMAVCAISVARVRDGAGQMTDSRGASVPPMLPASVPASEVFYDASMRAVPADLSQAIEFDYKRAKVVLAILCIQYGNVRQLATHMGDYVTMCAADGFHNEARWPISLPETEVQERRRLFWGAYTIDVYSATTWGLVVRHREYQSNVLYPTEVYDDDEITETGIEPRPGPRKVSFLTGWNFTSDLYRILEHALDQLRMRAHFNDNSRVTALYADRAGPSVEEVLEVVDRLYDDLPAEFKFAKAMSGNIDEDRYGYQAADIIVTMQTVKMVMTGLSDTTTVEKRCNIAGGLLDALSTVPTAYIQGISSPILHHLAGVGHLLGGVIQSPISYVNYLHVRTVLLAMVQLLSQLESTLNAAQGIADKLRDHVSRIDQYMTAAAVESRRDQVYHRVMPPTAWNASPPSRPGHVYGGAMDDRVRNSNTHSPSQPSSVPAISPDAGVMGGQGGHSWQSTSSSSTMPAVPAAGAVPGAGHDFVLDDLLKFNFPAQTEPNEQVQLPDDLLIDWPFDMSEAFDFLGNNFPA